MRLTDPTIRSLKAPSEGAVIFPDDLIPGFGVRVSEGGTKSFVLTHGPRRQRETLGRVGVVSLHDARIEAKRRLAEYTLGKDKPKPVAWTVALDEYLSEVKRECKWRTHENYGYVLKRHFKYGETKLADVSPHDLQKSLGRLCETPAEQQRAFVVVRAFIRWAHRKHYLDRSPMERMRAPHSYVARARILTDDELKKVWRACEEDTFGRIVKLLILTGQRRGEITSLTGSMVGDDVITIPAWLAKNGREHVVPLGTFAKSILGRPPADPDACYFPALGLATPFNGFSKCSPKLAKRAGVSGWTLHDLRRTFASGLAAEGVALPVIERLLNHVSGSFGGIVGVYQRYDFMPEMREAIGKWECKVRCLAGN
ncbi:MAG: tyrosine-type recombinase/integrase [Rhizomicrobium sp.]